jgi:hypothetical protein
MEENKEIEKEESIVKNAKQKVEKKIKDIVDQGIQVTNIDLLYKLVDIHKDFANEELWEAEKEEKEMMYGNYGNYGRESYGEYNEGGNYGGGRRRDSRGRYMEGGSYGRRGVPGSGRGRYRGEEMMDEMAYHYGNYNEGREQYGADEETMKSFKYMLKSFKDYYKHLKEEASSQQEVKMLEDVAREISQM